MSISCKPELENDFCSREHVGSIISAKFWTSGSRAISRPQQQVEEISGFVTSEKESAVSACVSGPVGLRKEKGRGREGERVSGLGRDHSLCLSLFPPLLLLFFRLIYSLFCFGLLAFYAFVCRLATPPSRSPCFFFAIPSLIPPPCCPSLPWGNPARAGQIRALLIPTLSLSTGLGVRRESGRVLACFRKSWRGRRTRRCKSSALGFSAGVASMAVPKD